MGENEKATDQCLNVLNRLSAYIDSELPAEHMKMIRLHLFECPRCRAAHDEMRALWDVLADPVPVVAPCDLEGRVIAALDKGRADGMRAPFPFWRLVAASSIAAVLGLIIGGWMGVAVLNRDAANDVGRSISATLDVFAPAPRGTFAEGYFAMLHNQESR